MKVVIDIDDDLYTRLFDNGQTDAFDMLKACSAIRKGTSLPDDGVSEVLDSIKAEVESMDFDFGDYYDHTSTIIEMMCEVIDKYKPEGSEKE